MDNTVINMVASTSGMTTAKKPFNPKIVCYACQQRGHIAPECTDEKARKEWLEYTQALEELRNRFPNFRKGLTKRNKK